MDVEGTGAEAPPRRNIRVIDETADRLVKLLLEDRSEKRLLLWTDVFEGIERCADCGS